MPIDINLLREHRPQGDVARVRASEAARFADSTLVDRVMGLDAAWTKLDVEYNATAKQRNQVQKKVGELMKQMNNKKKPVSAEEKKALLEEVEMLKTQIKGLKTQAEEMHVQRVAKKLERDAELGKIGNLIMHDVPKFEHEEQNEVTSTWGAQIQGDEFQPHHQLLWRIGGYEPGRGSKVAGHRGYFLKGPGVMVCGGLKWFSFLLLNNFAITYIYT